MPWRRTALSEFLYTCRIGVTYLNGGAENAGPENAGPENEGPSRNAASLCS